MNHFFSLVSIVLLCSCGVRVNDNCALAPGYGEIDDAFEAANEIWPDSAQSASVSCLPQEDLVKVSRCNGSRYKRITSCTVRRESLGTPALIYSDVVEDVAVNVCHELNHTRPVIWGTDTGCERHEDECKSWVVSEVDRCIAAVYKARE